MSACSSLHYVWELFNVAVAPGCQKVKHLALDESEVLNLHILLPFAVSELFHLLQ